MSQLLLPRKNEGWVILAPVWRPEQPDRVGEFPLEVWDPKSESSAGPLACKGDVCRGRGGERRAERVRWGFGVWLGLLPGIEDDAGAGLNSGLCSSWVCEAEKMALLCLLCTHCKGSRNNVTRQGPCRMKCEGLCGQLPASGTLWELKPVLALE